MRCSRSASLPTTSRSRRIISTRCCAAKLTPPVHQRETWKSSDRVMARARWKAGPPLPYALALAPTAESSPAPEFFFKNVLRQKGYPVLGQKPFLDRLLGEGHE